MLKEKHPGCAPFATDKVTRINPARNSVCTAPIAQSIGCNSLDSDIRRPKICQSQEIITFIAFTSSRHCHKNPYATPLFWRTPIFLPNSQFVRYFCLEFTVYVPFPGRSWHLSQQPPSLPASQFTVCTSRFTVRTEMITIKTPDR